MKDSVKSKGSLAICGTRGIPACYGGFETFCENIAPRFVEQGYSTRVYGRKHVINHSERFYRGVEIVLLPALKHKYLETLSHSFLSFLHLLFNRVDVVLVCNAANSPLIWILRLFLFRVVVNVDGIERKRAKWNSLGKLWYRLGEISSVWWASDIVADAEVIADYYKKNYGRESTVIAYGYSEAFSEQVELKIKAAKGGETFPTAVGTEFLAEGAEFLAKYRLEPFRFYLYVSRLEPENNAHIAIEAHKLSETEMPLVVVGDAPYADEYRAKLRELAGSNVILAGYQFGPIYPFLQILSHSYIQATEVGGTHPALVESMGNGCCVLANDTPEHREVLGEGGMIYEFNSSKSLAQLMLRNEKDSGLVSEARCKNYARASQKYSWQSVYKAYEQLLFRN